MIKNKKKLKQSEEQIQKLTELLDKFKDSESLADKVQYGALECRIEDIQDEIDEYNKIIEFGVNGLEFDILDLEKSITSLRLASNYTQKELAEKIGIAEQQIQRYEDQNYLKASFERIIQLIRVMADDVKLTFVKKEVKRYNLFPHLNNSQKLEDKINQIQDRNSLLNFGS